MPQDTSSPSTLWPVRCGAHANNAAIALCTRCGVFLCADCRCLGSDGLALCARCIAAKNATMPAPPGSLVHRFLSTAHGVLVRPANFMQHLRLEGGLAPAVTFGLVANVLGQLAFLFWIVVLMRQSYLDQVSLVSGELGLSETAFHWLRLGLLAPFAVARLVLYAMLLQVGVAICGVGRRLRYREYVRLFSYASAAYLLLLVPLLPGVILAFVYVLIICWHGLRHHHGLSTSQAFVATVPLAVGMLLFELVGL
jgi:hypothetical protein